MKITDISLAEDFPIINNSIDLLIQEINILFDTSPKEVLGDSGFGTDFEKFIWDLSYSNDAITSYVRDKINNNIYISTEFDININTTLLNGTAGDIILVNIDIYHTPSGDSYSTSYKIS